MKADKKVRLSVSIPRKEGEKLKSFPYFASSIVACLLDELFKRVSVADIAKEINATDGDLSVRLERLKGCISKAFSGAGRKAENTDRKKDYWKLVDDT
jgi:hypothetical protein